VFAVIGEALLDMVQPQPGSTFEARPGGSPLNVAVGLRRMGHGTAFMGRLSTRALGGLLRDHLERNELDLSSCATTAQPTTLAFATLDEQAKASYDFYVDATADWGWTDEELARLPAHCRAIHTGSLTAFLQPGADALQRMWDQRRSDGELMLSFDPNVRPDLLGSRSDAVARVERFVAASHVVKASDDDAGWLYPDRPMDDIQRHWASLGPDLVVITRGSAGCTAITAAGALLEAPGRSAEVVDTIGAGDAFMSGLLSGIADLDALAPGSLPELADADVRRALDRAVAVSWMTCRRTGADPPNRREYEEAVADIR
jgi:fructokinase